MWILSGYGMGLCKSTKYTGILCFADKIEVCTSKNELKIKIKHSYRSTYKWVQQNPNLYICQFYSTNIWTHWVVVWHYLFDLRMSLCNMADDDGSNDLF